jgi:hypothetical protein
MDIVKPIFIIGSGRSGSSIFHEMFSKHSDVTWLSKYCEKYPHKPHLNKFLMQLNNIPLINKFIPWNYPGECYNFWEFYCKGFRTPFRDLTSEDVSVKANKNIKAALSKMLTKKRSTLLIKITGWPRIGYLQHIFPDAKFIHIIRDGRAMVNSMLNVNWWWGWRGPQNWRWGELSEEQHKLWAKFNYSFVALAGIELVKLMEAIEKAKKNTDSNNYMEIKYEELCADRLEVFQNVLSFSELKWSTKYEKKIDSFTLRSANDKWQKEFTENQINILNSVLSEYQSHYNYT